MRINGGILKNKKIISKKLIFNPISPYLINNIFNTLNNYFTLKNKVVLDLFAGSGILGFESFSRGCDIVLFNDHSNNNIINIENSCENLKFTNFKTFSSDYQRTIQILNNNLQKIDLVFLDPPFNDSIILDNSLKLLQQSKFLSEKSLIILRTNKEINLELDWDLIKTKKYGKHFIYFFAKKSNKKTTLDLKKSNLIILSGPSGVGKSKIIEKLLKNKELNLVPSISVTTRKPRGQEKDKREYFFISKEEFLKEIKEDNFLEYAQFVENYYGTSKKYIEKLIAQEKNILFEIEVEGALQLKKKFPKAIWIFLFPPNFEELQKRIVNRQTETQEQVIKRMKKSKEELDRIKNQNLADYILINDDLSETTQEIIKIIKKFSFKS